MRRMTLSDFEARYRADPDPWGYTVSGYERDKYAATLAACGPGPFAHALELGASIGVFSAMLAPRCRRLTTIDAAPTAVELARRRLPTAPGVQIIEASIPAGIPDGPYDLVVASEILYYLLADELDVTLDRIGDRRHPGHVSSPSIGDPMDPSGRSPPTTFTKRFVAWPGCAPSTEPTRMPTGSTYWSAYERVL